MAVMARVILSAAVSIGLTASAHSAPRGALRICRVTDYVEPAQTNINRESIDLPALAGFDDWGREDDKSAAFDKSRRWNMTIITLQPVHLPPGTACTNVAAEISPLSKVQSVKPWDNRHLEFGAFMKLNGGEDNEVAVPKNYARILDTTIKVVKPFR